MLHAATNAIKQATRASENNDRLMMPIVGVVVERRRGAR